MDSKFDDSFKYYKILNNIMDTTQINIRVSKEFLEEAKIYAKKKGYLNVQEFFRDAARERIYDDLEVRPEYLKVLESKEANTFLSEEESVELDNLLKERIKMKQNERKKV